MGNEKLLLLLLLASALAQEDGSDSQDSTCSKAALKFKHLRKYVYNYEAATTSGVSGTADSQSGTKFNCKVELEVPQSCNFILRVKQCTLREVYGVSSEGKALLKKSKNSEDFSNAMTKYEVKVTVQDGKNVVLYPDKDEPLNVLNMKRGILSALLVDETQETDYMDTVYGKCTSEIKVTGRKGNTPTDVTVKRNLKTCDRFTPIRDYVNPLAIIKGMNRPLSTLISSSQVCQYSLDPKRRHITEASCAETHLFLPFSYRDQYGINGKVTQTLKLEDVAKTNSRDFDPDTSLARGFALEATKTVSKNEDAALENLQELQKLSTSEQNQQRASRFYKLVTALRGLNNDSLGPLVPRLMQLSSPIALQALTQCGTPECFGGILQVLRSGDISPVISDTVTFGLGLLPSPCTKRVRELLNMAQYQSSRASFYALSHAVSKFYEEQQTVTDELRDVADFMLSLIGNECTGNEDKTFQTLKAIGIMGSAMEATNPEIKSSLLKCARGQASSPDIQKAAIQAFRRMTMTDDVRGVLVQVFQDSNAPEQKRLAAYLMLMKNPSQSDLRKVVKVLLRDDNKQVKNFVSSHIRNILQMDAPEAEGLKTKLQEALKSSQPLNVDTDFTKLSQNYHFSRDVTIPGLYDAAGADMVANIIFDSEGYMPKEAMLEATLNVFGKSVDMFEIGVEGKGFEPTLDSLFGNGGFFPDCTLKALYWADGKLPDKVTEILFKWYGVPRQSGQNQDLTKAILYNVEKLIKEVRSNYAPEAKLYLEILGKELGYLQLNDFRTLGSMLLRTLHTTQELPAQIMKAISKGAETDLFLHYIFMDNEFDLPTGSGLQLQVSFSGVIAPGTRAGMKFGGRNIRAELSMKPAVAVEFVTQMGIQIPEFSRHAVLMNTNLYHESGFEGRFSMKEGQLKFSIPAPKTPTKLFSIRNQLNLVFASKTEIMASILQNRVAQASCRPLFKGINSCTNLEYSNASGKEGAPYFPLTGEARFDLEIQPTGEVEEYSVIASYNLNREDEDMVDTFILSAQAEGSGPSDAKLITKYNRNKVILTSDVQVPNYDVNFGAIMKLNDESTESKKSYAVMLDVHNQQVPEVTLTGKISYDGMRDAQMEGMLSIPRLKVQLTSQASLQDFVQSLRIQMQSSAQICSLSGSGSVAFTYDNEKIDLEWSTETNTNVKKIISQLPDVEFSDVYNYPEMMKNYANEALDFKVAQTDMTMRHIASQSLVAANNWLKKTSKDIPFANTLHNKLTALKELDFPELGFPPLPEILFLNSNGRIRGMFSKDSIDITIPLPYGGRTTKQLMSMRSPPVDMPSIGLKFPSKEFRIPSFTIPESYQLKVPLFGSIDLSSNVKSNYYNWSASYSAGNTPSDFPSYKADYEMKANAIWDILSYKIDGAAAFSYNPDKFVLMSYTGSVLHNLLEANINLKETYNFQSNPIVKETIMFDVKSILGVEGSFTSEAETASTNNLVTCDYNINGQFKLASLLTTSDYTLRVTFNTDNLQLNTESSFNVDLSIIKLTNKMSAMILSERVTITSTTDVQDGALTNTMTLDYRNRQLTYKSDTNGNYYNLIGLNKFEVTLSRQMAAIRSEYQADYKRNRFYTLLSGSLNSQGLELNADVSLNSQVNRAAHKATLKISQEGLSTSATTNVNFSPLTLENDLNAAIGLTGGMMKMTANGRYKEHNAKFTVDGKAALTELSFGSVYQATVFGVGSKNVLSFKISKEGLKFSNNMMGSYDQMKLENSNDLVISGSLAHFNSKLENALSTDKSYKHEFDLQLQPYTMTAMLNNEFLYGALQLSNMGQMELAVFSIKVNGNMRGAFDKDNVKHSYAFSFSDLTANVKTDTVANIQGTAHSHNVNMEIAGLSASFSSSTNSETKSTRFTNAIRSVVAPFTVTVDSHTNADGRLSIFGDHSGELYSKFILKAEPLSFNLVHDFRGSTSHTLNSRNRHTTLLDYKVNALVTPSEQASSWKLKSQLNQNTHNQDFSLYNNAEKIGIELSGQTLADLSILDGHIRTPFGVFNPIDALSLRDSVTTPQEFSISGFVKYDKNKDVHVINLPFIENIGSLFEKVRSILLTSLQALQNSLKSINIDQYVKKYKMTLNKIPEQMNDYINNLDLERRINELKEQLIALTKDVKLSSEELYKAISSTLQTARENLMSYLSGIQQYIQENYDLERLTKAIETLLQQFIENVKSLEKQYNIREKAIDMVKGLQNQVEKININELGESLAAWIKNVDDLYQIQANLRQILQKIQSLIQSINIEQIAINVREYFQSIDFSEYRQRLMRALPINEINTAAEYIQDYIVILLMEYEVTEKFNAVVDKLQDVVSEYEIDKKVQTLLENFIQLLNQQKVKETIKKVTDMLTNIDIKMYYRRLMAFIQDSVKKVKEYDFKKLVDDINEFLNVCVMKLKSFNYEKFVDDVNNWIQEVRQTINDNMKALELPQKAQALKQYMNDVSVMATEYVQQVRDTRLSAVMQWYEDIMSSAILNELRTRILQYLEDVRDTINSMNIKQEIQIYLQKLSQAYQRIVTYVTNEWKNMSEKIEMFAKEHSIEEWAERFKLFIEEGFPVPEMNLGLMTIPPFEVSLRALKDATFKTPSFTILLTDLQVPSVEINLKKLKEIEIPSRFVIPEFTILSSIKVPSYVIDLHELKLRIVRIIDQVLHSDFQWPSPETYLKDLKMSDMGFPAITFPEMNMPSMQIPEIKIPKLNLNNFQFADIQIPEFRLPQIPHSVSVPTFGKLSSSFIVKSPFLTLSTAAEMKNGTVSEKNPEFIASLSATSTSMIEALAFNLVADARISAPMLEQLILKETVAASNKYFKLDHNSEATFAGSYIQTKVQTVASLKTEKNEASLDNAILVRLQGRITAESNTKYSHKLNIPEFDISSQLELQNDVESFLEAGRILLISSGKGNWKWACPLISDEGTHQSNLKFNIMGSLVELSGSNKITDKYLKLDQAFKYDSALLSYVNVDITSKAESPYVGNSIISVKGSGQLSDMTLGLTATHNAELSGRATGTIQNALTFAAKPFDINLSTTNNGNLKVGFPLKLTGKIEFLNNYNFILNTNVQQISWQVNGRFNQYKVSHTISVGNNEDSVVAIVGMNGEANLDFLTIPISIPEMNVPYTSMKTPEVKDFSLWEQAGLKKLLTTTKQNVDLNVKLQYKKNMDVHSIQLPLDSLYDSINSNMKVLTKNFEKGRDNTLRMLTDSYNEAKAKFDKYKVENSAGKAPRTIRVPGYTIPLLNIEVSPFSAELPAFGYVIPKEISTPSFSLPVMGFSIPTYTVVLPSLELPVLHVPNTLRKLTLPKLKLPSGPHTISIPAMGNLTYDFSFKSNVISLTTSAGLYNQSDLSARISVASTSIINALQFTIDGTTGLTRKRGLKLATALAVKHVFVDGKHESSMSLGKRNIEASVVTNAKVSLPIIQLTFKQELNGNTKTKPNLSSKMSLSYSENDAIMVSKGMIDHTLTIEGLTSYFSMETKTNGDITGTLLGQQGFSGKFTNEANTYLNSNGLRSSMKLVGSSKADSVGNLDVAENLAVEATTSRIYAVWEHNGENYLRVTPLFTTKGLQNCKATFELALWSLLANLQVKIEQPNSMLENLALNQEILLSANEEKQEIGLNGDGTFHTIILAHNVKLSNDKTDARFQIDGSLQGHASMLKYVILPVYEKSLWEILKFDVTTSEDKQQYLNVSTSVTYTKNKEGFWFPIPINKVADGFVIKFPAVTLKPPQWMKDLPNTMRDMELPEVPSVLEIPSFKVPFTNLNVPSTKLDLNNIKISEIKSTLPFDINLPSLPQIKFPKVDITTKYITVEEYKIPFFEVTIPQHQITLARYTLPKSFYNIDFNSLVNKIADIDLPTIEIPEQNIEIPPIKMNLPAGIFIPAFGALAGTAQLSSPIYNLTWTNKMANNADGFVASIDASSSSTLRFLEYDLDASASTAPTNGLVLQGTFAHTDLSINWKDDINFNGLRIPGHNIDIDIKSPTFTDVQIRSQQENNKITSSVSSSSAGTLGLVLEKESSALKGKLFSRSLSTPGKDTLIMKGEVSLKNPERIQYKINWREEAAMDVLNGLKERLPKISNSIHNCVNKYHKEHFGMEISEAGLKMKENLQDKIASTYRSTANEINNIEYQLQSTARGASDKYNEIVNSAQKWYQDPKDMSMFLNDGEYKDKAIELVRAYQNKMKDLIDAAIKFVKNTRFQLPGQSRKYTGEELFNLGMKNVASNIDAFFKAMQQIYDACVQYINRTELKIPGTEVTIKGKEITDACKSFSANLERMTKKAIQDLQGVSLESALNQLKSFIQVITQKTVDMIKALQTKNIEDVKLQFQQMYSDAMKSDYARELQNLVEELKKATSQLQKYAQTGHEELSEKLKQLQVYAKALREEYLDPNIVGWSVKYYEIEEKVIQLLQKIVDSLKDLSSQYGINTAEITEQTKDFVKKYYQHANDLLTNANGQGKELIRRASIDLEDRVTKWSATARQLSQNANKILNEKLQATSNLFVNSYEKLIAEASRLIDIIIQNYNSFIEYVNQLLQSIQNSATEEMKTYISTRKGELKVEVPHPFDWKSFDEIPHLREDIISKRAEIARAMVLDGIDKGSQKWEELQQFIERQLQEGKLTAEQIIENIRNWQKN
ncbi:hypothetical protein XENTR_v10015017 [Xenopus tropicalis]|uniref:Apolipoprotein B-100 n=2 Tax=Xenopus tropicalis TaxID=8364 RepID=A0A8J0QPQ4_XENTR|nr:apolipoprotein B-100 [Xenopus tropicalis]KAE8605194.1 hypothetical protein XENTR_v10015017 [Xenopus tropicalis]